MYIWRFFKKPQIDRDELPERIAIDDLYPLYAFTVEKSLAKRFMKERDMNKFIVRKSKVTKEEYSEYGMRYRSQLLILMKLQTFMNKYTDEEREDNVEVLLTQSEYQFSVELFNSIADENWWINNQYCCPLIFNQDIIDALKEIDFVLSYKIFSIDSNSAERVANFCDIDDYSGPDWEIDQLAYFISLFGDSFKK